MYKIHILKNNNTNSYITFRSKREIRESEYIQSKLKYINNQKKNNSQYQEQMVCGCNQDESLELFSRLVNKKYIIAVAPKTGNHHKKDCIFYNHKEKLENDDGFYRSLIFEEAIKNKNNKQSDDNEDIIIKENHRLMTFNNFCYTLIEKSLISCFNKLNYITVKQEDFNFRDLKQPTYLDFLKSMSLNCGKQKKEEYYLLEKNTSVYDAVKNIGRIDFGITTDAIFNEEYFNNKYYKTFKMQSLIVTKNKIQNVNISINQDVIKKAKRSNTIYNRQIKPPYFLVVISSKNKNGYFSAKRFFAIPIEFIDNQSSFAFVDSDYERCFLNEIIQKKKIFIKPTKDEFNKTYKEIRTKVSGNQKALYLSNRPDVILFEPNNNIKIIEIAGMSSMSYKNQLSTKLLRYEKEIKRVKGLGKCSVEVV